MFRIVFWPTLNNEPKIFSMDPANGKRQIDQGKVRQNNQPKLCVLERNGAGVTVIPAGSWLHELDGEDLAGNGFQKANGRPHRIISASRLSFG
jgi:hypothetical protein